MLSPSFLQPWQYLSVYSCMLSIYVSFFLRIRLAFDWSFIWLSTASAMAVMERYGVNYR